MRACTRLLVLSMTACSNFNYDTATVDIIDGVPTIDWKGGDLAELSVLEDDTEEPGSGRVVWAIACKFEGEAGNSNQNNCIEAPASYGDRQVSEVETEPEVLVEGTHYWVTGKGTNNGVSESKFYVLDGEFNF